MILVAASAASMALLRADGFGKNSIDSIHKHLRMLEDPLWIALSCLDELSQLATFPLLLATFATLVLRLRWPRPRWRRLTRQPGLVAGLAIMIAAMVAGVQTFRDVRGISGVAYPSNGLLFGDHLRSWLWMFSQDAPPWCGFAVATSWWTQFLVGRWRRQPGWLDRLGRILGGIWIATFCLEQIENIVLYW